MTAHSDSRVHGKIYCTVAVEEEEEKGSKTGYCHLDFSTISLKEHLSSSPLVYLAKQWW
jgi:hypothetical protein